MDYGSINATFAVLALVANVAVFALAAGGAGSRLLPGFAQRWASWRTDGASLALAAAWIVGVVCTCGSLFLQFGEKLTPCDLCWFQRICMYPQALILGVALVAGDRYYVKRYMIALAAIGAVISVAHIEIRTLMDWFGISQFPGCSLTAPCSVQPITEFGWITIPYMALSGFLLIISLLLFVREPDEHES